MAHPSPLRRGKAWFSPVIFIYLAYLLHLSRLARASNVRKVIHIEDRRDSAQDEDNVQGVINQSVLLHTPRLSNATSVL